MVAVPWIASTMSRGNASPIYRSRSERGRRWLCAIVTSLFIHSLDGVAGNDRAAAKAGTDDVAPMPIIDLARVEQTWDI